MTSSILGWPVYPVSGKVWEYWIYTDVGPGMEITFTRTLGQTSFKFADMPSGKGGHSRHLYTWQRMNPGLKLDHVGRRVPTLYRSTFATGPLAYFFDSAGFKGRRTLRISKCTLEFRSGSCLLHRARKESRQLD